MVRRIERVIRPPAVAPARRPDDARDDTQKRDPAEEGESASTPPRRRDPDGPMIDEYLK